MTNHYTTECSDRHCILRDPTKPMGMRTNGGCQHLKRQGPEANAQIRAMGAEIVRLRQALADVHKHREPA